MFNVTVNNRRLGISFRHRVPERRHRGATTAILFDLGAEPRTELGSATVRVHPPDPFSKEGGRRKALAKLLNAATAFGELTRPDRAVIWSAFFTARGKAAPKFNGRLVAA